MTRRVAIWKVMAGIGALAALSGYNLSRDPLVGGLGLATTALLIWRFHRSNASCGCPKPVRRKR